MYIIAYCSYIVCICADMMIDVAPMLLWHNWDGVVWRGEVRVAGGGNDDTAMCQVMEY